MQHVPLNPVIDIDRETAMSRWYLVTIFWTHDRAVDWQQAAYDDTYRKVDGAWQMADSIPTPGISHPDR
jgi:hypothetical protein